MTKALLGARLGPSELALLDEVRRLRTRVAELEAVLAACDDADGRAVVAADRDVAPPTAD